VPALLRISTVPDELSIFTFFVVGFFVFCLFFFFGLGFELGFALAEHAFSLFKGYAWELGVVVHFCNPSSGKIGRRHT
jgi:hypothetical protein